MCAVEQPSTSLQHALQITLKKNIINKINWILLDYTADCKSSHPSWLKYGEKKNVEAPFFSIRKESEEKTNNHLYVLMVLENCLSSHLVLFQRSYIYLYKIYLWLFPVRIQNLFNVPDYYNFVQL